MGERKTRVLVVDDNPDVTLMMKSLLQREDVEVDTADGFWPGIERIVRGEQEKDPYTIIFSDVQMAPIMGRERVPTPYRDYEPKYGMESGFDYVRFGREKLNKLLPVVLQTGIADSTMHKRIAMRLGVLDYVKKGGDVPRILKRNIPPPYVDVSRGEVKLIVGETSVGKTEISTRVQQTLYGIPRSLDEEDHTGFDYAHIIPILHLQKKISTRSLRQEIYQDTISIPQVPKTIDELVASHDLIKWGSYGNENIHIVTETGFRHLLNTIMEERFNNIDKMSDDEFEKAIKKLGEQFSQFSAPFAYHSIGEIVNRGIDVVINVGTAEAAQKAMDAFNAKDIPYSLHILQLRDKGEHMWRLLSKYDVDERIIDNAVSIAHEIFMRGDAERKRRLLTQAGISSLPPELRHELEPRLINIADVAYEIKQLKAVSEATIDTSDFFEATRQMRVNLQRSRMERAA